MTGTTACFGRPAHRTSGNGDIATECDGTECCKRLDSIASIKNHDKVSQLEADLSTHTGAREADTRGCGPAAVREARNEQA